MRTAGNQLAAQQARPPVTLTEEEAAWITAAGADLRAVFAAPTTSNVQRKQLFRAVIAEIVVTVSPPGSGGERTAGLRIIWRGGASTELTVPLAKTGQHRRVTSEETLGLVRRPPARPGEPRMGHPPVTACPSLNPANRTLDGGVPG